MSDLISRQAAIDAIENINPSVAWLDYAADVIKALPPAQSDGAWEMFELISSAFYGKQYYFLEDCGLVYSRASAKHMSMDDAVLEFVNMIGGEDGK